MSKKTTAFVSLLFLLLTQQKGFSQGQGNTPYSVFGIGETPHETSAAQDGMGGVSASFANGFYINPANPALIVKNRVLGGYKYVAFNVGLGGNYRTIENSSSVQRDFGMNLNHISFAFPVKPKWAMAIQMKPYSQVSHKATIPLTSIPGTIESRGTLIESSGGLSRASYTNSFQIGKSLYLGLEAFHTFGVILRDTTSLITVSGVASPEATRFTNRTSFGGSGVKFGAAFQQKISEKWQVNIGGNYELNSQVSGEYLRQLSNVTNTGNGFVLSSRADTLLLSTAQATLPSRYTIGISIESPFKWIFAADYKVTNWNTYKNNADPRPDILQASNQLSIGMEYIPNATSTKYFDQAFYRLGYTQTTTPYVIASQRIMDRSFSGGISLPLGFRSPSYIDFAVAVGKRGTTANNLIQENYVRVSANFSLMSSWFIKNRID